MEETNEDSLPGKLLDMTGIAFIIGAYAVAAFNYKTLPATIPIHYNLMGEPDGWGAKQAIFIFPIIGTFILFLLSILTSLPESITKYPVKLTEENKEVQKALVFNLMRYLKIELGFLFLVITFGTVKAAEGNQSISILSILLPTLLILITITWYIYLSIKNK